LTARVLRGAGDARSRLERPRQALVERWHAEGIYGDRPLGSLMHEGATRWGETVLSFCGATGVRQASLADLDRRARRMRTVLHDLGLRSGDVVASQLPNWPENAVLYQAAFSLGIVVAPMVTIYGPAEMGSILSRTGARLLVVPDRWRTVDVLERVGRLPDGLPLQSVMVVGDDVPQGCLDWRLLERRADGRALRVPAPDPDEVCLVLHTSGTLGVPKGVMFSHNALTSCVTTGPATFSSEPSPKNLFGSPPGHIGGVIGTIQPFLVGIPGVYLDQWDPDLALEVIDRFGVTRSTGAPIHLLGLVEEAEADRSRGRSFCFYHCGGAAVPPSTLERAEALGWRSSRGFGSTEHPTMTASPADDSFFHRAHTDGRPGRGVSVRIADEGGDVLVPGADGEIQVIGPKQTLGYVDASLDGEHFTDDAWFRTGDVGHLDDQGYLTVTDRLKDLIIRGGENISSREVEDILLRLPQVVEAAAVAVPDPRYGERVCAFVRLQPGTRLVIGEVKTQFLEAGVAKQKTPELLEVVEDFPRTASGKIVKAALRARLASGGHEPGHQGGEASG
jgi:acyl-CoA synthetase (AMP-forming)/AMP-acid ligase II